MLLSFSIASRASHCYCLPKLNDGNDKKGIREMMDGLTSGERVLLCVILGLLAAAGLVQMGKRANASTYTAPPAAEASPE
jgi:hypothetical protein